MTIGVTLAATLYMVLDPARWVRKRMQLTKTAWDFELVIVGAWAGICRGCMDWRNLRLSEGGPVYWPYQTGSYKTTEEAEGVQGHPGTDAVVDVI